MSHQQRAGHFSLLNANKSFVYGKVQTFVNGKSKVVLVL
jgi:hypothetical protein